MKNDQQRKRKSKYGGEVCSLFWILMILILVKMLMLTSIVTGTELNNNMSCTATIDSVKIVYNDINAGSFPQIVSLVTVTNAIGFVIGKLNENDFEVYEENVRELPIKVEEFTSGEIGINVVLVIDRSGSMRDQPIADAKKASSTFVELMQSQDQSAVVSFSNYISTDCPFTSDKDSLKTAISMLGANGRTAIFDALIHSVSLMTYDLKNRAIILLTDGADNSSCHSYEEALRACLSQEVRVFTIGLGLNQNSHEEKVLIDFANETGGLYYYSPTSDDLEEIYRAISKLLHHRYQISYTTHNPAKDGTLRRVHIEVFVNNHSSSDTASYRAPYEPDPVDPIDPIDPNPVEPEEPVFEVVPNPFTPNDDGFNDWTVFQKGDVTPQDWIIFIMDHGGRLVRQLNNGERVWNGKDNAGILMLPGYYLYVVTQDKKVVHRGIIQLVR